MSETLRLANEANDFLDALSQPKQENLSKLSEYRSKMVEAGFSAPFKTLVARLRSEYLENAAQEAQDIKKHLKEIRYIASLKRSTLNRSRVAIAAHRFAQAFEDFGQSELIPYLPFGGDYKKRLIESGESAVDAYHSLISIFEQQRHAMKSASALVSFMNDGVEVERTINLDADKDAQEHIRKIFGDGAVVKEVELKRRSTSLIKNYSSKIAIFTAASSHATFIANEKMRIEEGKEHHIKRYNDILRKYGLTPDSDITETERFENVKKEMATAGFITKVSLDWIMEDEFKARLHTRRLQRKKAAISQAHLSVYQILRWYYICHNKESRASYGAMPSVLANPQPAQLAAFAELSPPGYLITNPVAVISSKLEMEERAPPMSSRVWGPAFVCVKAGVSTAWAAEEFEVDEKEIESALKIVRPLVEQPQGRGAQFLSKMK